MPNVLDTDSSSSSSENGEETMASTDGVDVLIHPSAIRTAPLLDDVLDDSTERDILQDYVQDVLTVPASLAGLPALSVPMRTATPFTDAPSSGSNTLGGDGWPIGISVVGQWGADDLVLKVAEVVERLSR